METFSYSTITPIATYSPWENDKQFNEIYSIVCGKQTPWEHWSFTGVDKYRAMDMG